MDKWITDDPLEWLYTMAALCGQMSEARSGTWDQIIKALAVIGPFLAAGIAYAAYTVANRQREIAQAKLKLDLFERRAKVYDAAARFLAVSRDYPIGPPTDPQAVEHQQRKDACVTAFYEAKIAARFILGEELADHLDELGRQYQKLQSARRRKALAIVKDEADKTSQAIQEDFDLMGWLGEQQKTLPDKFAPYLDLARWQ